MSLWSTELMTKEESRLAVINLVEKFSSLDQHKIKGFIQPLFEALGWDFTDTDEVSPENNISNGRVDYAFKLYGVSRVYVEAKAFNEDVQRPQTHQTSRLICLQQGRDMGGSQPISSRYGYSTPKKPNRLYRLIVNSMMPILTVSSYCLRNH